MRARSVAQVPPEHYRNLTTRIRERIARERAERTMPAWRRKANLPRFHDALDAAAVFEGAVNEFGYSFRDLDKVPA